MDFASFTERQLSLQAIRWLCQTAEALALCLESGIGLGLVRRVAQAIRICSDRAEHIAEFDIKGVSEPDRMESIARDLDWLAGLLDAEAELLQAGPPFRLTATDVKSLAEAVRNLVSSRGTI